MSKQKKQTKADIQSFTVNKSQIGRKPKDNIVLTTGSEGQGKSAFGARFAYHFDPDMYSQYAKMKAERVTQILQNREDRRNYWESLGRLLGMAYNESDAAFFALLEGFYRGRLNEMEGRRAMGGRKE